MVEDEILAAGAAISGTSGHVVETVLDNRILEPECSILADGRPVLERPDCGEDLTAARWIHLPGAGGFVSLAAGQALRGLREWRQGAWSDISDADGASPTPLSRPYATLWIDHGSDPVRAAYAYVQLPGTGRVETEVYSQRRDCFEILENSESVFVARHHALQLFAANVWRIPRGREAVSAGPLTADHPVSLIIRRRDGEWHLAVADPSWRARGTITVSLELRVGAVLHADPGLELLLRPFGFTLRFQAEGRCGARLRARLEAAE